MPCLFMAQRTSPQRRWMSAIGGKAEVAFQGREVCRSFDRSGLPAARQRLDQAIKVFVALIERFDRNAFILAMRPDVDDVVGHAGMTKGRNPRIAEVAAVGSTR